MTPYEILEARHAKTIYMRGEFKGDAPLERRRATHQRIIKAHDRMVVRMHATDILTAYRNGEILIDLNGWGGSSTTKGAINYALYVCKLGLAIGTKVVMGVRQTVISTRDAYYLYYDGIRFNGDSTIASTPQRFEMRRINADESKELMDAVKASGFKDVYPVLYAACQAPTKLDPCTNYWSDYVQDADHADAWPGIIEHFKFEQGWQYTPGHRNGHVYGIYEIGNAKTCWTRMMSMAKRNMYDTTRSEVTRLDK
jgi:hypothetical protein